jgi:hypothetical protein
MKEWLESKSHFTTIQGENGHRKQRDHSKPMMMI